VRATHAGLAGLLLLVPAMVLGQALDSIALPQVAGMDVYHANKTLKRLGMIVRFEQVELDTQATPVFLVASQTPESGAVLRPGDTVTLRVNCPGMLRYWNAWVVPLLGDFANAVGFYRVQLPPRPVRVAAAEYPDELRPVSFTGDAVVDALVDFDGSVLAARVTSSSGHREADSAACVAALGATFLPADDHGAPVRVWFPMPFHWQFKEDELPVGGPKGGEETTEP
jgi:TonB family protein